MCIVTIAVPPPNNYHVSTTHHQPPPSRIWHGVGARIVEEVYGVVVCVCRTARLWCGKENEANQFFFSEINHNQSYLPSPSCDTPQHNTTQQTPPHTTQKRKRPQNRVSLSLSFVIIVCLPCTVQHRTSRFPSCVAGTEELHPNNNTCCWIGE
mmetsp:Transcript_39201/g.42488  ORF Transcript_39201/g.42488 Transcript_39201/m.42488 type:complete len:153 (+) Transcript_39201:1708-2166(+)